MAQYSALRCVSGIWQNNEKPLISNGLRFVVTCLLAAALWVLFHCARHTFATLAIEYGMPIDIIAKILGHTNTNMTRRYAKISEANISREMKKIGEMLSL